MEKKKIGNKFAMHLSGVLEDMDYGKGIKIIESLTTEKATLVHGTEELDACDGWEIRLETMIEVISAREWMFNKNDVNLLEEYGITYIYFRTSIHPTQDEMIELLEEYALEYEEEDLVYETKCAVEEQFNSYNFDEVLSCFKNVKVEWDIVIGDSHYYRSGNPEIQQF